MAKPYEPQWEAFLMLRISDLEGEIASLQIELRTVRESLKEYREEHAEERAMVDPDRRRF